MNKRVLDIVEGKCLWHTECMDSLTFMDALPDACVDAVITDPPYLREHLWLYGAMAARLPRILKSGGSLLSIVPHFALPQLLQDIGQHLKYRWIFSMWQAAGTHPRMAMGIEVMWKPVAWWVNGSWPKGRGFVRDGWENNPVEKGAHPWEQSLSWAEHCLKVVPAGGLVLDPFMGSGTVGIACLRTGRRFLGVERESQLYANANRRIAEEGETR